MKSMFNVLFAALYMSSAVLSGEEFVKNKGLRKSAISINRDCIEKSREKVKFKKYKKGKEVENKKVITSREKVKFKKYKKGKGKNDNT